METKKLTPRLPRRVTRKERILANQPVEGMHREDIKAALRKKHRTLERLSRSWGLHPNAASVALSPGSYWPRVEQLIAKELGEAPHTIWPHLWNPDGTPKTVAERNITPPAPTAHRQKNQAA